MRQLGGPLRVRGRRSAPAGRRSEHIATHYALESRLGIRVSIGGRVRQEGREGTIVDTAGQRLTVLFDGGEVPYVCHVTSGMTYETAAG